MDVGVSADVAADDVAVSVSTAPVGRPVPASSLVVGLKITTTTSVAATASTAARTVSTERRRNRRCFGMTIDGSPTGGRDLLLDDPRPSRAFGGRGGGKAPTDGPLPPVGGGLTGGSSDPDG